MSGAFSGSPVQMQEVKMMMMMMIDDWRRTLEL